MTALKCAFDQDESAIGWDPILQDDPTRDITAVMVTVPILGVIFGAIRLLRTNSRRPALKTLRLH